MELRTIFNLNNCDFYYILKKKLCVMQSKKKQKHCKSRKKTKGKIDNLVLKQRNKINGLMPVYNKTVTFLHKMK